MRLIATGSSKPPATGMLAPFTNDASSAAIQAITAATSSGRPVRADGVSFSTTCLTGPGRSPLASVSMNPGSMRLGLLRRR